MENYNEHRPAGVLAPGDDNLYPNLPYAPAAEAPENQAEGAGQTASQPKPEVKSANPEMVKKIGLPGLLYAIFFTFCLYKNGAGITYPFYVAGTACFCIYTIRGTGGSWRGGHIFALIAGLLLGISTCLTDNGIIIFMNKAWLFVLFLYFLLRAGFHTEGWQLGKFLSSMFRLVGGSIGRLFCFFPDMKEWINEHKGTKNHQIFYVLAGAGCSIPLIAIVVMLLSSADAVFEESVDMLFGNIALWDIFWCIFWSVAVFLFSYGMASFLFKKKLNEAVKDRRTGQPLIAISSTAVIAVIYIYFCIIQIVYLFAGNGTLPAGYTYAQYARQGFFQLLFVCLLNLALVLAGLGFFRESKALKAILFVISLCTFVMIASRFYRKLLYISAYYLTFLRLFVLWALCVIALLMAGIVGKTFKNNFPLFQYGLAVITCCYIVLSFARPDYWIAWYNVAHMEEAVDSGILNASEPEDTADSEREYYYSDTWYLNNLSADAAPVIITEEHIAEYMAYKERQEEYQEEDLSWEEINTLTLNAPWYYNYMEKQRRKAESMTFRSYNFSRGYVRKMFQ